MPLTLSSSCTTDVCACAVARLKAVSPMCVQRCTFAWAAMSRRRQAVVCMCVCMYVFIYYVHTYAYLCTYTYTLMLPVQPALAPFISAVPRDLVCVRVRVYMYVCMYIHIYTHTYIYIYGLMLPVEPALAASMRAVRPSTSSISTDAWCSSSTCLDKWCGRMYACMDVCTHGSMCLCTYFCTCVVMYIFLMRENCIYVYVCDHIHTYIVCS